LESIIHLDQTKENHQPIIDKERHKVILSMDVKREEGKDQISYEFRVGKRRNVCRNVKKERREIMTLKGQSHWIGGSTLEPYVENDVGVIVGMGGQEGRSGRGHEESRKKEYSARELQVSLTLLSIRCN